MDDFNNFVKIMYNEVYNIPNINLLLNKNKEDKKEDKKEDIKKKQEPKRSEEPKEEEVENNTKSIISKILDTVDYTIKGIEDLYSHDRYRYKEKYTKDEFKKINYHRKGSCGPNNQNSIIESMRDNKILCEVYDYVDKDLLKKILKSLGAERLENEFIKRGITGIKKLIEIKDKDLTLIGLNKVNIDRFRKLINNHIEENKIKIFESRKKACNCEYERFLKNMVFRDKFNEIESGHIKPFREAREMCERCFKFEQEILMNGYIDDKLDDKKTINYVDNYVYNKIENKLDNKDLEKDELKVDNIINNVWFNDTHPKGFKKTISYEDFKDRIYLKEIKERQYDIKTRLEESRKRLQERRKSKIDLIKELQNINKEKKKLLSSVYVLSNIVDKYKYNSELYEELLKNGKVIGINNTEEVRNIEEYVDKKIPRIMQEFSFKNNLNLIKEL